MMAKDQSAEETNSPTVCAPEKPVAGARFTTPVLQPPTSLARRNLAFIQIESSRPAKRWSSALGVAKRNLWPAPNP